MSLTNLWALGFAALAIPIVIFYILKVRLRRIPISTVMFWQQIFEEKQPRSIWQKLRHLLSLLLQLAFLILLVLALARPYFWGEVRDARRVVLIVDNSASMQATDVAPTRLQAAIEQAKRQVASLRDRDEMAIVAAGNQPKVICGLTGHQRTLREALDRLSAGDGPTKVPEALELAKRLLSDHDNGTSIVLSDGRFTNAAETFKAENVRWISVGTDAANVAITQFQVRRSLIDPLGYEILAGVSNHSKDEVECRLEMELDGEVVDVVPLKLSAEEKWSRVFRKTSAAGGKLVAKLNYEDALAADNIARAILPKRDRQQVILVSEGNVFLQRVFQACPLVDLSLTQQAPATVAPETIVVYHKKIPQTIVGNKALIIQPNNSTELWDVGGVLQNPVVAKFDKNAELMQFVHLENVLMPEARKLTLKGRPTILAQTPTDAPLLATYQPTGRKIAVLTVNLDKGDLPLRTAFPILVSNALGWFAGTKGELREAVGTGVLADVSLPEALAKSTASQGVLILEAPDGKETELPGGEMNLTIGPLDQCGVWRIAKKVMDEEAKKRVIDESVESIEIACNLNNAIESDIRVAKSTSAHKSMVTSALGGRPVWFYLLMLGAILTSTEWFLYQRRWIS